MTAFFQLLWAGFALGCLYALIALGFTVIYRSSQVINFAQGAMILVGAYLVLTFVRHPGGVLQPVHSGLPFWLAVIAATAAVAAGMVLFQMLVLRRMVGKPLLSVVMITIGLSLAIAAAIDAIYGADQQPSFDPWGLSNFKIGGVEILWSEVWGVVATFVLLSAFFVFNRYSRYGLAMRAAAADPEAALGVGVPVRRVHALAWAIAGAVATVSGVFLCTQPNPALSTSLGDTAFLAFPAIILGGLDSPVGAVTGGIIIGVVQELTEGYAPSWTGFGFYTAAPYIVMVLVLLVKPYGLLGKRPVERV